MEYLYIYFYLVLTNILVTLVAMSCLLVSYLHLKKTSPNQFKNVQTYLNRLEKISKADIYSRYLIPFYGVFMSGYCIYLLHFDNSMKHFTIPSKFRLMDKYLNKFRIFKRNYK